MKTVTKDEVIQDLQFLARRYNELDQLCYSVNRESLDLSIIALEENDKLKTQIDSLEIDNLKNKQNSETYLNLYLASIDSRVNLEKEIEQLKATISMYE